MSDGPLVARRARPVPANSPPAKRSRPGPSSRPPSIANALPSQPLPKKRKAASQPPFFSSSPTGPPPSSLPRPTPPRRVTHSPKPLRNTYGRMIPDGLSIAFDSVLSDELTPSDVYQWLIAPLSTASFYANFFEKRPFALLRSEADTTCEVKLVTTSNTLPGLLKARLSSSSAPSLATGASGVQQVEEDIRVNAYPLDPSAAPTDPPPPPHYYSGWFSKADVLALAASSPPLHFTTDLDVTQYKDGKRLTLNPPSCPPVTLPLVRRFLSQGCSIRFLSPQEHHPPLHRLLHLLDDALGMQVGANAYLTPKGTQGFSPHYDDVDVWIMQTEGKKRWRLYEPTQEADILPLHSSRNFDQAELGPCIMDVWLSAGDFLYAPRGTVHQCVASEEEDSLHVTVSSCLRSSWGDYLSTLLAKAVERAKASDAVFRRVLPTHFHRFMGGQNNVAGDDEKREAFMDQTLKLIERLVTKASDSELSFDAAADEMALDYMHGRIQPFLLPPTQRRTRAGNSSFVVQPSTYVRIFERDLIRLTPSPEQGSVRVHHIVDNAKRYKAAPLGSIDVDVALAAAVHKIIREFPKWVRVTELPFRLDDEEEEEQEGEVDEKVRAQELVHLCQALYDSGVIEVTDDQLMVDKDNDRDECEEGPNLAIKVDEDGEKGAS